jgi:hypothetical protein
LDWIFAAKFRKVTGVELPKINLRLNAKVEFGLKSRSAGGTPATVYSRITLT